MPAIFRTIVQRSILFLHLLTIFSWHGMCVLQPDIRCFLNLLRSVQSKSFSFSLDLGAVFFSFLSFFSPWLLPFQLDRHFIFQGLDLHQLPRVVVGLPLWAASDWGEHGRAWQRREILNSLRRRWRSFHSLDLVDTGLAVGSLKNLLQSLPRASAEGVGSSQV